MCHITLCQENSCARFFAYIRKNVTNIIFLLEFSKNAANLLSCANFEKITMFYV